MDVKEAIEKKKLLEQEILKMINTFKDETGLNVTSIDISFFWAGTYYGKQEIVYDVEAHIALQ